MAREAGDREAEHVVWREREARQAACQAKIDAATVRMDAIGVRVEVVKDLAMVSGLSFG
jgi:hypothetical protein